MLITISLSEHDAQQVLKLMQREAAGGGRRTRMWQQYWQQLAANAQRQLELYYEDYWRSRQP